MFLSLGYMAKRVDMNQLACRLTRRSRYRVCVCVYRSMEDELYLPELVSGECLPRLLLSLSRPH